MLSVREIQLIKLKINTIYIIKITTITFLFFVRVFFSKVVKYFRCIQFAASVQKFKLETTEGTHSKLCGTYNSMFSSNNFVFQC